MSNHTQQQQSPGAFLPSAAPNRKKRQHSSGSSIFDNATLINDKDQGVQGVVMKCMWKDEPAIMKMSNHIDFVLELEEAAWSHLKSLNCIHFCEVFEKLPIKPGECRYCLFYKEITNNSRNDSLAKLIFDQNHLPNAILNCVRQTLAAIVMFEHLGITHYDMHADNAMVTDTPYDVHVYKFGDSLIPIRTYGLAPVIIDFGLSYIPNNRYNASCMFTKDGFTTYMPDSFVDSRLLLITAVKELKGLLKSVRARTYRVFNTQYKDTCNVIERFIKKVNVIYNPLRVDPQTGWFIKDDMFPNVVDELMKQIPDVLMKSNKGVFKPDNFDWIIELLQHEITVPVTQYNPDAPSFGKATLQFAIDWKKFVEPVIRNTYEEQVFFKDLVTIPHDADTSVYTRIRHRYPKVKNIKRLRGHIKEMGGAFNNFLYEKTIETQHIKDGLYAKLPYKSTQDILCALPSMPNEYTEGMTLCVMDPTSPNHKVIVIDEDMASALNKNEQETLQKYVM
ncbi:serine-threonine protein kinase [carnivorous sponge associated iridovirus]|jgi:hypothetical protein|nr:serine-threonine protein kinase [carnivorous sponge associated iridovirus]